MPQEQFWRFYSFLDKGECVIHQWMDKSRIKTRGIVKIEARLRYLRLVKVWEPHYVKKLSGYEDIFELRVVYQRTQYRPLGCFGPINGVFTLLVGAVEKGGNFYPRNAPDLATQRREDIYTNRRLIHEYEPYEPKSKKSDEQ